jgi:hypothetical protein
VPDVAGIRPVEKYAGFLERMYIDGLELPSIHEYEIEDPNTWENLRKDPKIRHAIDYSLDLACGDGYNIRAVGNDPKSALKKDIIQAIFENLNHFHDSFWAMLTHRFRGVSYTYIKGKPGKVKLPDGRVIFLEYLPYKLQNIDKDRVKITWKNDKEFYEVWSLSVRKWLPLDPRATMIITNSKLERSVGQGDPLLQALSWAHYCKKRIEKAALQLIDRFSGGFIVIRVDKNMEGSPDKSAQKLMDTYISIVPKARANKFMVMRKEDELQILEPNGQGVQIIQWLLGYYDQSAQIAAIGSNLPVDASGVTGSFALADVQENSNFYNVLRTRKGGESALNDQFITLCCSANERVFRKLGIYDANNPVFEVRDPQTQQPEEAANSVSVASQAGLELDDSDVREKLNLKEADPEVGKIIPSPYDSSETEEAFV